MAGGLMGRVWAEIGANNSELLSKTKQSKDALKDLASAGGESGASLSSAFLTVAAAVTGVIAAVKIGKDVFDFSAEGAQIGSLISASRKLAISYGTDMDSIVSAVKKASFNTITEYDAMKAANLSMTMGVSTSAEEIGNLMQIAIMRGRAFGLTTEEAFSKISTGIGRGSIKILDDLGFNMKGVTGQAAMLAAVLAQGNKELADMGGLLVDISTGYQRIGAAYGDFWNDVKRGFGEGFSFLGLSKEERGQILTEETQMLMDRTNNYADFMREYLAMRNRLVGAGGEAGFGSLSEEEYSLYKFQMTSTAPIIDDLTTSLEGVDYEMQYQVGTMDDLSSAWDKYHEALKSSDEAIVASALPEFGENIEDITMKLAEMGGASGEVMMNLGLAFGEIDENLIRAYDEIKQILDAEGLGAGIKSELIAKVKVELELPTPGDIENIFNPTTGTDPFAGFTLPINGVKGLIGEVSGAIAGLTSTPMELDTTSAVSSLEDITGVASQAINLLGLAATPFRADSYHYIHVITTGGSGSGAGASGKNIGGDPFSLSDFASNTGMHGGSFIGLAHGGIVAPGYSNDGMLVAVSSGERLDVTPAGNKSSPNDDLLAEMKAIRSKLDNIPTAVRDAVLLVA